MTKPRNLRCSFCQRMESEVEKLVAGPRVYICDRCVQIADQIMKGEPREPQSLEPESPFWQRIATSIGRWLGRQNQVAATH